MTLHWFTLGHTKLHYTKLYSTPHTKYLQLQLQLQYITLDYTTLHYTTLHYLQLRLQRHNYNYMAPHHATLCTLYYTCTNYKYNCSYSSSYSYPTLHKVTLHYSTLHCTTLRSLHHLTTLTTPSTPSTWFSTATTVALHHTTSSSCEWGDRPRDQCNHVNYNLKKEKKTHTHNSPNHFSVDQWIRSAIRGARQPSSPIGFLV